MDRRSRWLSILLLAGAPAVALATAGQLYRSATKAQIEAQEEQRARQGGNQSTEFGTVVYEVAGPWREPQYTYTPIQQGNSSGVNLWPSFDGASAQGTPISTMHTHNDPGSFYNGLSPSDRENADERGVPTYAIEPGDGYWADCVHEYDPVTKQERSACDGGKLSES